MVKEDRDINEESEDFEAIEDASGVEINQRKPDKAVFIVRRVDLNRIVPSLINTNMESSAICYGLWNPSFYDLTVASKYLEYYSVRILYTQPYYILVSKT